MDASAAGRNEPTDPIIILQSNLAEKHKPLLARRDELLSSAADWPDTIESEDQAKDLGDLIDMFRKFLKETQSQFESEKAPYLAAGRAVDGFFTAGIKDKAEKEGKRLKAALVKYLDAKAAAELRRRQAEEKRLREEAEAKLREAQEAERVRLAEIQRQENERREAERKAALLRNPNDGAPIPIAELITMPSAEPVNAAMDAAIAASAAADKAARNAMAKPAEMSRVRGDRGSVSSLKRRWTGEISDRDKLDIDAIMALLPHLSIDDLNKAARSFAKANCGSGKPTPALSGVRLFEETYF